MMGKTSQVSAEKNLFTLKHWQIIDMIDSLALEGHLHDRYGYPDGIQIRTSSLTGWTIYPDYIDFRTTNSTYRCYLDSYLLSSNSLFLLDDPCLEHALFALEKSRKWHYQTFLREQRLTNATILNWDGCDCPYLKWIAYVSLADTEIEEQYSQRFDAITEIAVEKGNILTLRCSSSPCAWKRLAKTADVNYPLFLENTGSQAIHVSLSGTAGPLCILPGSFIRIR